MKPIFLLAVLVLAGCGSPDGGDDRYSEHRESQAVVYDPYAYNPRFPLALFELKQDQYFVNGDPDWSQTSLTITNISGLTATFNYIVSGPGWRYESAVVELPPNGTVTINNITHHFRALDNVWVTIPDVIYSLTVNG